MSDLFGKLKGLDCVKKVSNLYKLDGIPTFIYYLCPKMNGSGLRVNELATGLTVRYTTGISRMTEERLERAESFLGKLKDCGVEYRSVAIWSDADGLLYYPVWVDVPPMQCREGLISEVCCNRKVAKENLCEFWELYRLQPWTKGSQKLVTEEKERIQSMLSSSMPKNLTDDFIRRIFSGFALDGKLIKRGCFGENPIILGVESVGVSYIQNSALAREEWLPIVELY